MPSSEKIQHKRHISTIKRLKSLQDGLSKYFSTNTSRRTIPGNSSRSRSTNRPSKNSKVKKFIKQGLRGDRAEMLVDGLSEFFKTKNLKRRSAYRTSSFSAIKGVKKVSSSVGEKCSDKKMNDTEVANLNHEDARSTFSDDCLEKECAAREKKSTKLQKRDKIKRRHHRNAFKMNKKEQKCRLLNGLHDGLSHLYTAQGMRQRKSLNFYRDNIYRSCKRESNKFLHIGRLRKNLPLQNIGDSTFRNRKFIKRLKPSYFDKNSDITKNCGNIDVFPEEDCILFKKALRRAHKFLDQQDKSGEKDAMLWPSFIEIGQYEVATWYSSPYPNEYTNICKLYICEFCLKYLKSQETLSSHLGKCQVHQPPGDEIYQEGSLSVFQVDGNVNKSFCQNLCLLAKLYLQHKTLYHDVEPFLFYVLTINDSRGCHIVGYFSKEKYCQQKFNLSCLMTLPQYQRQGYGRFLIEFSYLLSRKEGLPGTPEKPLSDLGKLSYFSYWKSVVIQYLLQHSDDEEISVDDISRSSGVAPEDIISTLATLNMIGQSKDSYMIMINKGKVQEMHDNLRRHQHIQVNEDKLNWNPHIFMNAADK